MPGKHTSYHFKLVHPTTHLILRLARDIESDHILAPHGDGLQTRLCTRISLEFFVTNLTLVQGKSGHPNRLQSFCADGTNLIAHRINLGHVEEDAIRYCTPQSLITHPNPYDHQVDGLTVLFGLAGITFEIYVADLRKGS